MTIYAVMKTGGKEYRVAPGDVVRVEKLAAAPGATVEVREVCLIAIGQDVTVGSPSVADARVVAEVIEEGRGEKIVSFRKKRRNHYQMTIDDVQSYTTLRIREIAVGKSVYELPPPVAAQGDAPVAPKVASEERVGTQPQAPRVDPAPEAPQPSSDAARPVHAVEAQALAPSSTETPPARVAPPPRVVTAAPALALDERGPRKRSYGIAAVAVALLVVATGLLVWSSRQPPGPVEAVAAVPQAARSSVAEPPAKAPPRKETAIRKPVAASAPSAPVQPPE